MSTQLQEPVSQNGNTLQPTPEQVRLQQLKAAAYDCHRQIVFLSQVHLPELERQIAELSQ